MSAKAERLRRLLAIRTLRQEFDKTQLEVLMAAANEVKTAIAAQAATAQRARQAGRAALDQGDRPDWLLADAEGEVAGWKRSRLGPLLSEREQAVLPAREQYLESRREQEQVKVLVEAMEAVERVEAGRREQAQADDWFLGKLLRKKQQAAKGGSTHS